MTFDEIVDSKCSSPLYWKGCYSGNYDLWCPDAYSHPAKMSVGLAYRIMEHLKELNLLSENDIVLDPMCGISTTGIVAGALGHPFIGVELEDKFIRLSEQNKEYAEKRLHKKLDWKIIQGDSRRLSEILQDDGLKSVMSPPFGDMNHPTNYLGIQKKESCSEYSDNPDNIGNLKDVPLKAITSPPYRNSEIVSGNQTVRNERASPLERDIYGITKGQIGNLPDKPLKAVMSPPYEDSQGHPSLGSVNKDDWGKEGRDIVKRRGLTGKYGDTEEQVGNTNRPVTFYSSDKENICNQKK